MAAAIASSTSRLVAKVESPMIRWKPRKATPPRVASSPSTTIVSMIADVMIDR
ncbi:Uncharacterised protein [Mycobacterium tuberculosis]|nr:Uncharacterised protein [Mycobacterium tuberculosis]COW21242.1 Uncharacterised protein [Mycobacterium tuberculosis]